MTCFDLEADMTGPIGLKDMRHARLALRGDQIPLLKYLYRKYILVCLELVYFLIGHADTLESVSFNDCWGSTGYLGLAEHGIPWDALFTAFSKANPRKLRRFEILPINVPYQIEFSEIPPSQSNGAEEVRLLLEEDPKRRVFAYAWLDDKYGTLYHDEYESQARFLRGDDVETWERLMEIVKGNMFRVI